MKLENISITLQGFAREDDAKRIGNLVGEVVLLISRYINLERLETITIAYDYEKALLEMDCGYETKSQLSPTKDSSGIGVAMAKQILKNDTVKVHMVFNAPYLEPLDDKDHEFFHETISLIAHECGHVEELKIFDSKFPNILLRPYQGPEYNHFLDVMLPSWQEYAACRISSPFCVDETLKTQSNLLVSSLENSLKESRDAIKRYRLHGDINLVWKESGRPLFAPMRYASYFFGYLDGLNRNIDDYQEAHLAIMNNDFYREILQHLHLELQTLWSSRETWLSFDVFSPLKKIADTLYCAGGLHFTSLDDGTFHIGIPFSPETMPD